MTSRRPSRLARWLGVLRLSRKQLQQRWLESTLIVLGIALGVGVLTAGETFVRFQNYVSTTFLAGQIREWEAITVRPLSSSAGSALFGSAAVPAVRVSLGDLEEPVHFTLADLLAMRTDVPGVKYVTVPEGSRGSQIIAADDVALEPIFYEMLPEMPATATPDLESGTSVNGSAGAEGENPSAEVPTNAARSESTTGGVAEERVVTWDGQHFMPRFPMLQLQMVTPDEFDVLGYEFIAGAPFTWDDFIEANRRIVLERASAERLFPDMNAVDVVGRTVTTAGFGPGSEGDRWTIVGVMEFPEQLQMMVALEFGSDESNRIFGYTPATVDAYSTVRFGAGGAGAEIEVLPWTSSRLFLSPEDNSFIPEITANVQAYFDQKYGPGRVELRNPEAERQSDLEGLAPTIVALLVLAGLGLIIAAVNVLNLFTARVLRRMRITGMSVALGATRRLLFWQTAAEALLLGAAGSVLGVGIAGGFVAIIRGVLTDQRSDIPAGLDLFAGLKLGLPDVAIGLIAGVGLSLIFGLYPAWLGSRQDPVEALRVE